MQICEMKNTSQPPPSDADLSSLAAALTSQHLWDEAMHFMFFFFFCVVEQNSCRETQHAILGSVTVPFFFTHLFCVFILYIGENSFYLLIN